MKALPCPDRVGQVSLEIVAVKHDVPDLVCQREPVPCRAAFKHEVVDGDFGQVARDESVDAVSLMQTRKWNVVDSETKLDDLLYRNRDASL